jgi:squalene-hopene/tetraprenyl-beta-curcumene cyclase
MRSIATLLFAALLAESAPLPKPQADTVQDSLRQGAEFLLSSQHEDGSWSTYKQPAIAALCAIALYDAPAKNADVRDAAIDKAMEFVLSFVKEGGAIAGDPHRKFIFFKFSSYPNYSTAISLLAMATVNKPEYEPIMRAARDFLRDMQVHESGSEHYGGFGYDVGKKSDASNTGWAVEALHATNYLDHESLGDGGESARKTKAMWNSLAAFLEKTQNLAADSANPEKKEDGGFGYRPDMVSSGAMTYQGLKSMIYAKLDRQDPRVKGAMRYIRESYQIDAVPGSDFRGYYYYLQTMAKALDAYGDDVLELTDGSTHNWRVELVDQLASLQRDDGSWLNERGRYMEAIPELVTAYALISLKIAK